MLKECELSLQPNFFANAELYTTSQLLLDIVEYLTEWQLKLLVIYVPRYWLGSGLAELIMSRGL